MRAIVFQRPGVFELCEMAMPEPGPTDVIVQVESVGLCGTDVHVLAGDLAATRFPIIPGHETSGTVHQLGSAVLGLAIGDRVVVDPSLYCGRCRFCSMGRDNLCENWDGAGCGRTHGSTAEYVRSPAYLTHRLPDSVDLGLAALVEPLSCAIHGYDRLPRRMGEHYLIYGAGTMGLIMAQLAPRAGAATVTVVDINPSRLEAAREIGIDRVVGGADEAGRVDGWDVVIDCTGVVPAIEDGLTRVRRGGTFLQFGVTSGEARAAVSPFRIYNDEITVLGSMAVMQSFGRAVELFAAGALSARTLVSHTFTLDDYADALDMFRAGTGRKLQIRPNSTVSGPLA